MSRATINTGGIDLNPSEQTSDNITRDSGTALHIAVLGDFSGRKSRAEQSLDSLSGRKLIEISRDNFDEVFAQLNVQLQLPVSDTALAFAELDDLHPDFIYQRVGLFDQLRILKRKLKKKDSFDNAAEEIQAWASYRGEQPSESTVIERAVVDGIPMPDSLLDAALAGHDITAQLSGGPLGSIDSLIKDIISPFVEAKSDPRQQEMLAAVDEATSETMRAIMHHSDFQQLEASWRGVYWLLRQVEADTNLRFYLMDVSQAELRADLARASTDSHLYQQLVESRRTAGGTPIGIIVGDYQLQNTVEDVELASQMAALAADGKGCWLSGGHEQLAGCESLSKGVDPDHWQSSDNDDKQTDQPQWQQMRSLPSASHLALASPRFLLRLPFGSKTASMENFDYEELAENRAHDFYLWGNGAFLVTSLLAQGYSREGWGALPGQYNEVGGLPLHVYEEDGESMVKPCAEVLLTDRATAALNDSGLLALRSVQNQDSVRVPTVLSMANNKSTIQGLW